MSEQTTSDTTDTTDDARESEPPAGKSAGVLLTRTVLRTGLVVLGFALLLFALGQAFGVDLVGPAVEFLGTETGRWLAVAFLALVLISVAASGWRYRPPA